MSQHINPTIANCPHPANDLIEAVAFGFATDAEQMLVQRHVNECETCAEALQHARFAAEALPLAVPEADDDRHESIWAAIEADIATEVVPAPVSTLSSPAPVASQPFRLHWAAAAVLALLTLAGGILLGRAIFENDVDNGRIVAQVQVMDPEIPASGTVEYDPDQDVLVLRMDDMPAAPEGYVYQVWVIANDTPVSIGTLDTEEFATARNPSEFQTLAITVEEGPFGNEQPTTDPIVVVDLTQFAGD